MPHGTHGHPSLLYEDALRAPGSCRWRRPLPRPPRATLIHIPLVPASPRYRLFLHRLPQIYRPCCPSLPGAPPASETKTGPHAPPADPGRPAGRALSLFRLPLAYGPPPPAGVLPSSAPSGLLSRLVPPALTLPPSSALASAPPEFESARGSERRAEHRKTVAPTSPANAPPRAATPFSSRDESRRDPLS